MLLLDSIQSKIDLGVSVDNCIQAPLYCATAVKE